MKSERVSRAGIFWVLWQSKNEDVLVCLKNKVSPLFSCICKAVCGTMSLSQEVNVVVYVIVSQSSKTLTTTKLNCPYISAQTLKCVTALKLSAAASHVHNFSSLMFVPIFFSPWRWTPISHSYLFKPTFEPISIQPEHTEVTFYCYGCISAVCALVPMIPLSAEATGCTNRRQNWTINPRFIWFICAQGMLVWWGP